MPTSGHGLSGRDSDWANLEPPLREVPPL